MRNTNKKGFTIVELVVVVAVIAILAAVLIPTFSGIIRKANISADTVLAKSLNSALAAEEAFDDVEDFNDVKRVLKESGYFLANLNAKTDGCYFVWDKSSNTIFLVDAEDGYKVIFPTDVTPSADQADWYFAISDPAKVAAVKADGYVNAQNTVANTEDLSAAIAGAPAGETTIHVDESLTINTENVFVLDNADAKVVLDLGESVVAGNNDATFAIENVPFRVLNGELEVKGGTIKSTGKAYDADGEEMNNVIYAEKGDVKVEGTTIDAPTATILVAFENKGNTNLLKDMNITAESTAVGAYDGAVVTLENCNIDVVENHAIFSSTSSGAGTEIIVNGGVYHGKANLIGAYGGKVTIEDGVFNCDLVARTFKIYGFGGTGTYVIKGGTFNGVAFENLTEDDIRHMCNISEFGYSDTAYTKEQRIEASKNILNVVKVDSVWTITLK